MRPRLISLGAAAILSTIVACSPAPKAPVLVVNNLEYNVALSGCAGTTRPLEFAFVSAEDELQIRPSRACQVYGPVEWEGPLGLIRDPGAYLGRLSCLRSERLEVIRFFSLQSSGTSLRKTADGQ